MHRESSGKCRRLVYAKIDIYNPDAAPGDAPDFLAGDVIGVNSGGGVLEELTGDELIDYQFNDPEAHTRYGCIEEYFTPVPSKRPMQIDLTKVNACIDAVTAHKDAKKAESDFVFETSIELFRSEAGSTETFRHNLRVQEVMTRDAKLVAAHDAITDAQTQLEILCEACETCCDELLSTRDDAVTFKTGAELKTGLTAAELAAQ